MQINIAPSYLECFRFRLCNNSRTAYSLYPHDHKRIAQCHGRRVVTNNRPRLEAQSGGSRPKAQGRPANCGACKRTFNGGRTQASAVSYYCTHGAPSADERFVEENIVPTNPGPTTILIDNTTIAGAGRILYEHDGSTVEGSAHAQRYFSEYKDARNLDRISFAEFLTALVLFDELKWDGSSCVQDLGEMDDSNSDRWVYDWFPVFRELRKAAILREFDDRYIGLPGRREDRSRHAALEWTRTQLVHGNFPLPHGFRIPQVYQSETYFDRHIFDTLNEDYQLDPHNLAVAAFLYRGMFYMAKTFSEPGWAYLPHSFRGALLSDARCSALSIFCNDQLFPVAEPIDPLKIINELGRRLGSAAQSAVGIDEISSNLAIGASFLQLHPRKPQAAFEAALQFRESAYGVQLRRWFENLVSIGVASNRIGLANRFAELERDLKTFVLSKYGSAFGGNPNEIVLMDLTEKWGKYVAIVLELLPVTWQEAWSRLLNTRIGRPTGMQVLLSYYLPVKQMRPSSA